MFTSFPFLSLFLFIHIYFLYFLFCYPCIVNLQCPTYVISCLSPHSPILLLSVLHFVFLLAFVISLNLSQLSIFATVACSRSLSIPLSVQFSAQLMALQAGLEHQTGGSSGNQVLYFPFNNAAFSWHLVCLRD